MQGTGRLHTLFSIAVLLMALSGNRPIWATSTIEELLPNNERLELIVKKSVLVKLVSPAERVSIVATEIADVNIVDPQQILITATAVGETSLLVWTTDGNTRAIDITVRWNTEQVEETLHRLMPDEAINVESMDDGIALQGMVRSPDAVGKAMEIAQSYVPKVLNFLQVPGVQQVLLKVKIAEVASSFRDELGFNFLVSDSSFRAGTLQGDLISGDLSSAGSVEMSDVVTTFFGIPSSDISGFIQALKSKGWLHVLAQPNLIARSGETANFLAGGEFPIPVVQSGLSSSLSIEFKEFGIRLQFTPTVLADGNIHLDISPEVSDLDFSNGLKLGGFVVPALITRRAHTVIQLQDGQTFAIAGLLSNTKQKTSRRLPGMSRIPILGTLFTGKEISEKETELLIMVTPHLIAPLENGEMYEMPMPIEIPDIDNTSIMKDRTQYLMQESGTVRESDILNGKGIDKE